MNPGHGLGTIDRQNKDGSWKQQDVHTHKGQFKKWYKNDDDSDVTVKATLMGGEGSGSLHSTGQQYDGPSWQKPNWQ